MGAVLALLGAATPLSAQQQLPPPLENGAASGVPVAVQVLRWHMLDDGVSTLTFRNMDQLFTTRTVGAAGTPWHLPRADHALDFSYEFKGQRHAADDFAARSYTNALLVMKDGRILSENYYNGSDASTRFMGWSMTKSITSTLVGTALADGLIQSLDDPITRYLPELRGGGYDGTTIRQILQMRSGVDYPERYDFANPGAAARNHIAALVKNNARFADAARTIPRAHPPGQEFAYKTLDTAVLGWLIERVSGGSVAAYTARKLWEPLGAEADGYYIMDGAPGVGREFSGAGFNATLRDWARFGQMMLDQGVADGRRIVSSEWVAGASAPAVTEGEDGGYGLQWWTMPGSDAYAAIGLQGQFVYIDPPTRTVIVKLSHFPPGGTEADAESRAFFRAAAAWTPE
ncbi:serine hydrolase domain-containing protein [Croceibacterium xixiisoli]|uniref:serine hydrolase domain-containing protein n=1 Tax=Croceibacterium xixiisoli TaxID=1476466 RepID=UPI001F22473A|nr:serine hydrolase [Croceibacterium xixiisoli]